MNDGICGGLATIFLGEPIDNLDNKLISGNIFHFSKLSINYHEKLATRIILTYNGCSVSSLKSTIPSILYEY